MNKIFKVIYNIHTATYQAVSELGKSHATSSQSTSTPPPRDRHLTFSKIALTSFGIICTSISLASPTGGQVTAGTATIKQAGNITNINQSSQNAAINWQSFNVGKNETVNFNQPNAGSVTLNRVIGNERSVIDGAMNANGKVFISNANGMLIGKDAKINVGSLVATTANISDDDFMNGRYQFTNAQGNIENLGQISVPKGGVVALVAPIVKNGGTITAPQGNVLLASAENFSITLPDNANFKYTLDKGTLQGLVDNGGAILADGGRVVLTAQGVDTVKKSLIKHTGAIQANTVQNKNGVIELLGNLDNSALNVSGSLKVEAKESGDGGFIETSASQVKIEDSAEVSTLAENGKTGTWLIDPKDFTIKAGKGSKTENSIGADTLATNLKNSNVVIQTVATGSEKGNINVNAPVSWSKNRLTLSAHNDIHINANMNGSSTAKLALEYGQGSADGGESDYHIKRGVKVNLPIGNTLTTKKGKEGEKIEFTVIHQMPDIIKNKDGDWESQFNIRNIAFGKDIDLSYTKDYEGFAGWQLPKGHYLSWGRVTGLGHTVDQLSLSSKKSNQNIGFFQMLGSEGYLRDIGVTQANITADGYHNTQVGILAGAGSNIFNSYATGNISTTQDNDSHGDVGGLVGSGDYISNSYANVQITTTARFVGGLAGSGAIISNSYATGNITATRTGESAFVGGLVGDGHHISNSYATGNITATGESAFVGGLVGHGHHISNSYASNNISTTSKNSRKGGLFGKYKHNSFISNNSSDNSFFNQTNLPNSQAIGVIEQGQPTLTNITGKTDSELKQKSTFTSAGWDFDTVWYINAGEMPKLHAHKKGTITINPNTPNLTDLNIQANNLRKVYDGIAIENEDQLRELAKTNGYSDIVTVTGLKNGDALAKLGTLRYDSEGNTWKGAKDANKNGETYKIIPSGLTGGQDYEIKYGEGTLTINPENLTITLLPNFFDNTFTKDGKTFADVPASAIGVIAKGLVKGEKFKLQDLNPINTNNLIEGQKVEFSTKGIDFTVGKKDNYNITIKPSYLVYLPELKDMTYFPKLDNKNDQNRVEAYKQLLDSVRDELILAGDYVYRSDFGRNGRTLDSFDNYENVSDKYKLPNNIKIATQANGKPAAYDLGGNLQMAVYQKDENKSQYIIAFRGSQEGEDWWTNAKTSGLTSNQDTYLRASETAKKFINSVQTNGKNFEFVFTGHSLGGSLAPFVGASLDLPNSKVVTFNTAPLRPILWEKLNHKQPTNIKQGNITNIIFDNDMLQYIQSSIATKHQPSYLKEPEKISLIGGTAINDHLYGHMNLDRVVTNTFSELYQKQSNSYIKPTWSFKPLSTQQKRRVNASIFTFKHLVSPLGSVYDAARDIIPKPVNDVLAWVEKPNEFVGTGLLKAGYEWTNVTYSDLQNSMSAFDSSYRNYDKLELPNALKLLIQTDRLAGTDISSFDVRNVMKSLYIAYHLKSYDEKTVKTLFQQAKQSHRRALMARYDTAKDRVSKATIAQQIRIFDQFTFEKWIAKKGTLNIDAYGKFF